jgi:hypothetical protein
LIRHPFLPGFLRYDLLQILAEMYSAKLLLIVIDATPFRFGISELDVVLEIPPRLRKSFADTRGRVANRISRVTDI